MRFSVLMLSSFNKVPSCSINPSLVDLNVSRGHISSLTSVFYVSVQTISESCISSDTHHFKNFTSSFLSFSVCWTCFECTYASSVDACRHGAQNYSSRHQHTTRHHETHRGASGVLAVSGAGKKHTVWLSLKTSCWYYRWVPTVTRVVLWSGTEGRKSINTTAGFVLSLRTEKCLSRRLFLSVRRSRRDPGSWRTETCL